MTRPSEPVSATKTQPWWLRLFGVASFVLVPLIWWLATYPPQVKNSQNPEAVLSRSFATTPQLAQIRARGYLRVATLISPTIYIPDKTHPQGLEYDLVTRFAQYLGLGVRFIVAKNIDDAYALVASNQADFAAAGLVVSLGRETQYRYGPSYLSVRRQLIYRQGVEKPKSLQDIGNAPLAVEQGSNSQNWLIEQSDKGLLDVPFSSMPESTPPKAGHEKPDYAIRIQLEDSGINTLQALENGTVDYAVVLSHEAMLGQKMSNKIRIATDLGPPVSFAWAFSRLADKSLYRASVQFFTEIRQNNELKNLIDRHYTQFEQLDQTLAQQFVDDVDQRISPYLSAFKAAGKKYAIDWRLLAAMGYQESKWQPDAQSQQGAYGMMQIMPPTAAYMGLTDPGNPVQNITAAAKYLNYLRTQIDDQAPEPDLTYLALAAYNLGIGHLNDAIKLTRQQGGDPNRWRDIRERLAQLSNPKIYPKLRNGFARGEETVQYVENIRALHDLMIWVEIHNQKMNGTFRIDSAIDSN